MASDLQMHTVSPFPQEDVRVRSAPIRVAFIGAGNMAGLHLRALRRVSVPHTVVGVYDANAAAARAFAQRAGATAYDTLAELLAEGRPELVHVCTPAGTHLAPARLALLAGAHVYVEKPFVETREDADALFTAARTRGLIVCAGHQLVREPAYRRLMKRVGELGTPALVTSEFAFRPPKLDPARASGRALAAQLIDVLPHPLYTLVDALERVAPAGAPLELVHATATPTDLHALVSAGGVIGRLHVSLRARPVASSLTVSGAEGSLTADFMRAIVTGAANPGTSPIEKLLNPFLEAAQLAGRSALSLLKRFLGGGDYPGLVELLSDFYVAVATGRPSPLGVEHLRRVAALHEDLSTRVRDAARPVAPLPAPKAPLAVVTGAGGFFGASIARQLARRGFRVRGLGRGERPDEPQVHEWIRADLAGEIPRDALAGATVVVHAAAETAGGFDAHARNTVEATRRLLDAMRDARVRRLIHVSSISVLRPPSSLRERQNEATPTAERAERLGPYTWGKCAAEELVAAARDLEVRIIRPAALVDWAHFDFPGLMGRRLFGRWHLGLGRPGLPFAICEVEQAGAVVAWCADHFDEAPTLVNLMDPTVLTRGRFVLVLRSRGWRGRIVWVPISFLSAAAGSVIGMLAMLRRDTLQRPAIWPVLRPRRYDPAVSAQVFARIERDGAPAPARAAPAPEEAPAPSYA